jgi:hypothetical protein
VRADGFTNPPVDFFDDYSEDLRRIGGRPRPEAGRTQRERSRARASIVFRRKSMSGSSDDGCRPTAFGEPTNVAQCLPRRVGSGDLVLGSTTGIDDIGQAGIGALSPLVAQGKKSAI